MTAAFRTASKSTAIAAVTAATIAIAAPAHARDEVRVPSLTAPFGAGITEQVVIFERLIANRHPWLRLVGTDQITAYFLYTFPETRRATPPRHRTLGVGQGSDVRARLGAPGHASAGEGG